MRHRAVNPDALKANLIYEITLCEGSEEHKKKVYALALEYLKTITYYVQPQGVDIAVGVLAITTRLETLAARHNFTRAEWNENVTEPFFEDMKARTYEIFSFLLHDSNRRDTAGQTEIL